MNSGNASGISEGGWEVLPATLDTQNEYLIAMTTIVITLIASTGR